MGAQYDDDWANLGDLLHMDVTPFDAVRHSAKPVVSAVNGIAQGGGMMIAMLSDVAVASDRATFRSPEVYRGIADTHYAQILPHQVGIARARDLLLVRAHTDRGRSVRVGAGHTSRSARRLARCRDPGARRVLLGRARGAPRGETSHQRAIRPLRPHGHGRQPGRRGVRRGLARLRRAATRPIGSPRTSVPTAGCEPSHHADERIANPHDTCRQPASTRCAGRAPRTPEQRRSDRRDSAAEGGRGQRPPRPSPHRSRRASTSATTASRRARASSPTSGTA